MNKHHIIIADYIHKNNYYILVFPIIILFNLNALNKLYCLRFHHNIIIKLYIGRKVMDNISTYSSAIIKTLMEVKEISYFELKRYFENNKIYPNSKEINIFDFNHELDKLENMGIIKQHDGMIIFEGV